ncbi:MAG: lytic transglycosylase domain-containing protein, partial [Longimicrobiales bacterium]
AEEGHLTIHARTQARLGVLAAVAGGLLVVAAGANPEAGVREAATSTHAAAIADAAAARASTGLGPEWDLPNLDHPRVDYWVARFDTVPEMRAKFEGFLEQASRWAPVILEELDERGMPRDLLYLAMIESGFNPDATSWASAAGVWQFIPATGRRYGLAIDRAVDERRDPVRATEAALDYLEDLYDRFGSWYLAAAAYNTGENRVGRIMRREFGTERAVSEEAYYKIWESLPSETADYVPLMIAAARITKNAERYGFEPVELDPFEWRMVEVPPATPLAKIAEAANMTVERLRAMNPHFRIHRTPNDRRYTVRVAADAQTAALAALGRPTSESALSD